MYNIHSTNTDTSHRTKSQEPILKNESHEHP
ncbi:hypothetical protein PITC_084100 [Penicillium italicum]|uniref:Uncharacterized protein n=1 Tax=Penicillium italicum TaxID=40296 RepID=A0A0A2L3R8_PENIT|nr:hypothetical protein PITC_084100 [Penicillium italicum]